MTDPASANSTAASSEAWRRKVLDLGSAAIAALAVLWLLAISQQPLLAGSLPHAVALYGGIASVAIAAIWRSGPYRLRASLFLLPLLGIELGTLLRAGLRAAQQGGDGLTQILIRGRWADSQVDAGLIDGRLSLAEDVGRPGREDGEDGDDPAALQDDADVLT